MHGLQITYETLGATRNEASIDVLISALDDENANTRRSALAALLSRSERRAPELVLANWDKLQTDDLRVLRPKRKWLLLTIADALECGGSQTEIAITAAEALQMTEVLPQLVLRAESSASRSIKKRTTDVVLELVEPLGLRAREDRDQATVRGPARTRLADSANRFSMHRNERLIDAFLVVSSWGDAELRQALSDQSQAIDLICKRMEESDHPSVVDLLAGFIRRRNVHPKVVKLMFTRQDDAFRDALLRKISAEPSATVLRNLREMGLPNCLKGGEPLLDDLTADLRAAASHAYAAAGDDLMESLHVIVGAVARGGEGVDSAAALGLSRCDVPDIDFWMRAAVPVADGDEERIKADPNAHLLHRLIHLLNHTDAAVEKSVRRVLEPLNAEHMLERFESLRPRSRRRLGRVVMMVDPEAVQRVRDSLRHPVLGQRLKAIAMADALAAVDLLSDAFEHISTEDHQEARVRAAEVMGDANGEVTLGLLQRMTDLPDCPVKDAALSALNKREKVKR
ncbi:MAG: hypothetical protein AAGG48_28205 [Planctomycetota bacterium]